MSADSRYLPMPTTSQSMHDILGSGSKPPLPPQRKGGINTSQSHHVLSAPESPSRHPDLRHNQTTTSNSSDALNIPVVKESPKNPDSDMDHLNAEPYLRPVEVRRMLNTPSPLLDAVDSKKFLSVRETKPASRPALPLQISAGAISGPLSPLRQASLNKKSGHRRTASTSCRRTP